MVCATGGTASGGGAGGGGATGGGSFGAAFAIEGTPATRPRAGVAAVANCCFFGPGSAPGANRRPTAIDSDTTKVITAATRTAATAPLRVTYGRRDVVGRRAGVAT